MKKHRLLRLGLAILLPLVSVGVLLAALFGVPALSGALSTLNANAYIYPLVALLVAVVIAGVYKVLELFSGEVGARDE